jgi:hypothetical protein
MVQNTLPYLCGIYVIVCLYVYCLWRSNYQEGGKNLINGLSLEIQLTKKRLGSH